MRDLDDQAQIRTNHERSCLAIALLDLRGQFDLLIRSQKRDLPDLAQVNLNSAITILGSHITLFHQLRWGDVSTIYSGSLGLRRSRVVAFSKVFNKVKYLDY